MVLSALIAGLWPALSRANQVVQAEGKVEESLLPQQIETLSAQPLTVKKIYNAGKLVGVVSDMRRLRRCWMRFTIAYMKRTFPIPAWNWGRYDRH
ncbi:MAG: hypothetical protein ACLSA6_12260 [Holdemania massiliensis]